MPSDPIIFCPSCGTEIKLTESLAAPLLESTKREFEQRLAQQNIDISKRETAIREQQLKVDQERSMLTQKLAESLAVERPKIAAEESQRARLAMKTELSQRDQTETELRQVLAERESKLAEAQRVQAEFLRKQRDLDDARRELELTIEQRVQSSLGEARRLARDEVERQWKLALVEREEMIGGLKRQIEDLKRKAEQGSQQLQGEVQEIELENALRASFSRDRIEPVPKGEHGGDVLQRIYNEQGQFCGTILWESKRTQRWSDTWLPKLREDQRAAKAEHAIVVSQVLPKDHCTFNLTDGIWICSFSAAIPLAIALRHSLVEIAAARQSLAGHQTKMELVYEYLTGPRFRHRIHAIVEKFSDMREDLEKERKSMTRMWAKREEQIRGVIESTAGFYGDLQGIAGRNIPELPGLSLEADNSLERPTR